MDHTISKQERPIPKPGTYYRCLKKDESLKPGDLVVITEWDEEEDSVTFAREDDAWIDNLDHFLRYYKFAPEGKEERERQMQELIQRLTELRNEESKLETYLENLDRPLISVGNEELEQALTNLDETTAPTEQSTALLAQTPDAQQALKIKKGVSLVRNKALKFKKRMAELAAQIQKIRAESEAYLEAFLSQTSSLQEKIKIAEEVIWTVNIYLGRGEEIVPLKEGKPADAEEKIAIRQLVLYMDEETAFKPMQGGMDFKDLDQLDKWLLASNNLDQVLPEQRGIIAFKARRKDKVYDNSGTLAAAMYNAEYNKENKRTYFLFRNGENLYRVTTDIDVGENLVPKASEFDELFERSEYSFSSGESGVRKVKPGTREFSKAMERADSRQRHYGRILLFLQGILDRTKIFAPLINENIRPNLLDRKNHESYIRYIYDAEKLLPTGRFPFWKWIEDINRTIDTGHRIIGIFDSYETDFSNKRVFPKGAEYPPNKKLHTLTGKRGNGFVIQYPRTVEVYDRQMWFPSKTKPGWGHRGGYRLPKTQASCVVYREDKFYLDFDAAKVDDMEFYLKSRVDRHEYMRMFPILETCLALKKKEAKEEKPFRALLVGQIMKEYEVDQEDVEKQIDELILWWKTKNRTHRALLSDDAKAVRMIVQEYGIRLDRIQQGTVVASSEQFIVDHVVKYNEGRRVLYIGHRDKVYYTVYVATNQDNLFVDEQIWVFPKRGEPHLYQPERKWRTIESSQLRWRTVYGSEDWTSWRFGARREQYLSDPEIDILMEGIWKQIKERLDDHRKWYGSRKEKGKKVLWPLAITLDHKQRLVCWFYDKQLTFDAKKEFLSERGNYVEEPEIAQCKLGWKRVHGKVTPYGAMADVGHTMSNRNRRGFSDDPEGLPNMPWDRDSEFNDRTAKREALKPGEVQPRTIWTNPENVAKYVEQFSDYCAAKKQISDWQTKLNVVYQANKAMEARWLALEYQKFLAADGDPELWESDGLSELKKPHLAAVSFEKACSELIVQGKELVGLTVENITDYTLFKLTDLEVQYLPLDLILLPEKDEEEENEEEAGEEEESDDEPYELKWEHPT